MNAAMTNTVGYYNGNKWPVKLVISELNVQLQLGPGDYILDVQGRKINDAFFDKYTRPLQLSKEISKNGPVPLLAVPRAQVEVASNTGHQHSVRAVTSFTEDANGRRVPALPSPAAVPPKINVNMPTHRGMSVEEARKQGLIGKPRVVSEDYGVTDTEGRPVDVSQAPPIKYAMESTPRVRTDGPLPVELTQMDERIDPSQATARAALVGGLQKASATNVESATSFMNQVASNQPPNFQSPLAQPVHPATQPPPADVVEAADEALPAPNIFAANQVSPVPVVPDPLAEAKANAKKAIANGEPKPVAPKNNKPFVCNVDGQDFRYRSQLESYAKRKFPDKVVEILAPYPAA